MSTFPSHHGFPLVWKGSIPVLIEFGRKIAEYDEKPFETASNGDHLIMWLSRGACTWWRSETDGVQVTP